MICFKYALGQKVTLVMSGETGVVIGQGRFNFAEPSFLVRYRASNGRLTEAWWTESAIEPAESPTATQAKAETEQECCTPCDGHQHPPAIKVIMLGIVPGAELPSNATGCEERRETKPAAATNA